MAEGFITRRGGKAKGTAEPTISLVSKTFEEIVFTITNNDDATADIFWELADDTPDENQLELTSNQTSSNQTISGLDELTTYTIFAFANAANKAGSTTVSLTVTTPAEPITFIEATGGTTTTYEDNGTFYKSHTFTSSGNFVVNSLSSQSALNELDYLIIAGGGGGGGNSTGHASGGGGAGGFLTTVTPVPSDQTADSKFTVTATTFGIVVGSGGTAENAGTNSTAFGRTATSGGFGAFVDGNTGGNGGSGGGGTAVEARAGGVGILGQGRNGGTAIDSGSAHGAGGGGAGSVGDSPPNNSTRGNGGIGLNNNLRTGSNEARAGGGGGGSHSSQSGEFGRGVNGGGNGGQGVSTSATRNGLPGSVNTGGGGGGGGRLSGTATGNGGTGGSGIVLIRYEVGEL